MARNTGPIEKMAYATVGVADTAVEAVKDRIDGFAKNAREAGERAGSAVGKAERRGRSAVRKLRRAAAPSPSGGKSRGR